MVPRYLTRAFVECFVHALRKDKGWNDGVLVDITHGCHVPLHVIASDRIRSHKTCGKPGLGTAGTRSRSEDLIAVRHMTDG